ncbi:cd907f1e-bf16-47cf-8963-4e6f4cc62ba1-CDS [Sclerotinia trifoliorum]|uniref:Cd907f1e-bf16-47cf-8963-4e6f4cc62ba1-CDS n=1 Tax=Sclerotinia trifoliorum TaxID=28548 RepID=A0A8H2VRW6_9HELO|nr:cd907f1e-bf16-47cf-8963-4e6f4cc62ba1-CDS [Sclerotinia trifoliorum]
MKLSVPIIATTGLTVFLSPTQAFTSKEPLPSNESSLASPVNRILVEFTEEDQELFGYYETITHLLSNLHGRIGINDDASINYHLGRKDHHYIDPKDLKLVSVNDLEKYHEAHWVKINEQEIVLQCGAVNAATTGEDWALMHRCSREEVAIRRLMATFNDDGHEFVVSVPVLQAASKIREGTHRCIKTACQKGPLAFSTPTPAAILPQRAVAASQIAAPIGTGFSQPTSTTFSQATAAPIGSHFLPTASPTNSRFPTITPPPINSPEPSTLMTITRPATLEDLLPKLQPEDEVINNTSTGELPAGLWLSRRQYDPYITLPRPQCSDPGPDFVLSGRVRTITPNPRRTSYTTIEYWGFTTTSTVPHDSNRPPPPDSIIYPTWVTASFWQTFSCRKIWMEYFNMDDWFKRDIVVRVLDDLQAASRR